MSLLLQHAAPVAAFSFSLAPPRGAAPMVSALRQSTHPSLRVRTQAAAGSSSIRLCMADSPLSDGDSSRLFETVGEMEPAFLDPIGGAAIEATENSTVLPLFPLGAVVYTPFSEHRLNIFEPRYRAMYNDILFRCLRFPYHLRILAHCDRLLSISQSICYVLRCSYKHSNISRTSGYLTSVFLLKAIEKFKSKETYSLHSLTHSLNSLYSLSAAALGALPCAQCTPMMAALPNMPPSSTSKTSKK